ncbi:hypothetical protein XENTR_v10016063 [Xenopus tropicalis]|nr:hypothetical protein XENTR_v10016063 [Xenopus tropicalis]
MGLTSWRVAWSRSTESQYTGCILPDQTYSGPACSVLFLQEHKSKPDIHFYSTWTAPSSLDRKEMMHSMTARQGYTVRQGREEQAAAKGYRRKGN